MFYIGTNIIPGFVIVYSLIAIVIKSAAESSGRVDSIAVSTDHPPARQKHNELLTTFTQLDTIARVCGAILHSFPVGISIFFVLKYCLTMAERVPNSSQ